MIGETLGNYRVLSAIGKGGMGEVFLAEHTMIGRRVAIKVLLRRLSLDADSVSRFFNEARAAAKLNHPGLVEVFDFGHHTDGSAYIVMELLVGESLKERIEREERLAPATALAIARQVANALEAAHERGIIHRDLKPENIYLLEDPEAPAGVRVKVLDFGIAKLIADEAPNSVKTKTGAVFGTPRYMSPEQCKNAGNVDRRADIYALGCILFEMLLGRSPFDFDNWGEMIAAHIHLEPPKPRDLDPELPPAIERVVMEMLAKNVQDRYATMAEVADAIEDVWRAAGDRRDLLFTPPKGLPTARPSSTGGITPAPSPSSAIPAASPSAATTPVPSTAPTLPVAAELSMPPPRTRRGPWIVLAGVVALGAAGLGFVLLRNTGDVQAPSPAPASAPIEERAPVVAVVDAAPEPPASVPTEPGSAADPTRVELVIESVPSGADVYRRSDGVKLGKTPLRRSFERVEGGEIELLIKRSGYQDRRITLSTARDGKQVAKLSQRTGRDKTGSGSSGGGGPTLLDPYGDGK